MNTTVKKSVLLARVSSRAQEDEGYSLDAQEKFLKEYCDKKDLSCVRLFKIAETASKTKERQVFNEMMKHMVKNRINVLVVEKVDRLTRSFKDMVMIDDWLEADENREVHLVKDGLVMNKRSRSQDKLNWGVKVLFAKNYTDNLREEVYKGRKEKLAQGWLPGRPPFGYMTVGEKGKKIHVPNPKTAPLVKMIFNKYLDPSYSLSRVTKYAAEIGVRTSMGRPMSRSALIDHVLKNPFYIGINRWEGVDYPGKQDHLIDDELFDAVKRKMSRKQPPQYKKHNPDLRNMIFCAHCGGTITWDFKDRWYGYCNRRKGCPSRKYAKQTDIEEQLFKHFDKLLCPTPEIAEWIVEALRASHQSDIFDHATSIKVLRDEHDRKKRQLDILYEDRLSERVSAERYDVLSKKLAQEQEEIEKNIAELGTKSRGRLQRGIDVLEKSQKASKIYPTLLPEAKRVLLSELFSSLQLDGQSLVVKYSHEAEVVSKTLEKHQKTLQQFREAKITPSNGGDQEVIKLLRPVWRAVAVEVWNYLASGILVTTSH